MTGASPRIRALQAAMVRLTVDPSFGSALYKGDPNARTIQLDSGPYRLTDADLALFQAVDPRAWTTDRYRRARLVQAVVQEYAVTTALVGVAEVDAFFGSDAFARVLGHRGSMAEAFGDWAAGRCRGTTQAIVKLETAICRARRGFRPAGPGFVTKAGSEGVSVPEGTLAAWQQGLGALGGDPVAAAAQGVRWQAPALGRDKEHLLIEQDDQGGLGVHMLSAGVVGLLVYCRTPRSRGAVSKEARRLRISKKDVSKVLRRMQDEGMLMVRPG